jgi:hypothetical protein
MKAVLCKFFKAYKNLERGRLNYKLRAVKVVVITFCCMKDNTFSGHLGSNPTYTFMYFGFSHNLSERESYPMGTAGSIPRGKTRET